MFHPNASHKTNRPWTGGRGPGNGLGPVQVLGYLPRRNPDPMSRSRRMKLGGKR